MKYDMEDMFIFSSDYIINGMTKQTSLIDTYSLIIDYYKR